MGLYEITITDEAASQIQSLLDKAPDGTQGIRLSIKGTGCSGNTYKMDYASDIGDGDDEIEHNGAKIYIPKTASWMLIGTQIDYSIDDLGNAGFDFTNPNETARCGCGESFSVADTKLPEL